MNRKSIGQLRFAVGKNKHTLFDNLEVSVDKIRHKVSQTISSFNHTRKNKSISK
jgi:chromosome condensin MukBEF ATPase and DNA-binding subunit MukB